MARSVHTSDMQTYEILPGAQYDPSGVAVTWKVGHGRAWTIFDANGKRVSGDLLPAADRDEVSAAAGRVGTTRIAETITLGEPEIRPDRGPLYPADWCHNCYNPRRQCECC